MQRLALVALVCSIASAAAADQASPPRALKVAVLDIRPSGVEDATARTFSEILAVEVGKLPNTTVITDAEVANLIGLEQRKQIVGCDDNVSCAAEIAGALGVDKLCTGSMGRVESTTVLTLRVLDVATAKVDVRLYETETGGAAAFIQKMPQLVARLFPDRSDPALLAGTRAPANTGMATNLDDAARRSFAEVAKGLQGLQRLPGLQSAPAAKPVPPAPVAPPAPVVKPAAVVKPVKPGGGGGNILLNPWAWAGAGSLLVLGGAGMAAGLDPDTATDEEYTSAVSIMAIGTLVGLASAVLCVLPGPGSGSDAPPLAHPFQVIDGAPDRRAAPSAPDGPPR